MVSNLFVIQSKHANGHTGKVKMLDTGYSSDNSNTSLFNIPGRFSSLEDHFLLIHPTFFNSGDMLRAQEISAVRETNERMFRNVLHPEERNFYSLFDLAQQDKINIIANGDIYFDQYSQLEKAINIPHNVCYALSR